MGRRAAIELSEEERDGLERLIRLTDGIVAAFRRHFSVVEILIIESDLAKRHVA